MKFNLVLDLSWLDNNPSMYAITESFQISYYRLKDNLHEVQTKNIADALNLIRFLANNDIRFVSDEHSFIKFELKADIYLDVMHHIELRAKD
jgi:hypothetical protein